MSCLVVIGAPGGTRTLQDADGRVLRYLRLSVTDRCDLRCPYCMPAEGIAPSPRDDVLGFEEMVRLTRLFVQLGVETVRLTGGEPLIRRGLPDLVRMLRDDAGVRDIAMTTNATALKHHARALVQSGLSRINVSLDSLDPDRFRTLTRGGDVSRVLEGIEAVIDAGIGSVKTNTVVMRDQNADELGPIVEWAWARGITPRFIELMPIGVGARISEDAVVSVAEMLERLAPVIDVGSLPVRDHGRGPAGYARARDGSARRVGFIGAVTESFCDDCNRIRVTARGEVRPCLAWSEGISLRALLREDGPDEALIARIEAALRLKPSSHDFGRDDAPRATTVEMSRLGG